MHTERGFDRLVNFSDAVVAIALSFVVIGTFWRSHHAVFEDMTGYSRSIMSANFAWLAGIVFLPLPTVLLVITSSSRSAGPLLYIGTMLVSLLSLAGVATLAQKQGLRKAHRPVSLVARWSPVALMAVAFVLAAVVPHASLWPLLLLFLETPIARIFAPRTGTKPASD